MRAAEREYVLYNVPRKGSIMSCVFDKIFLVPFHFFVSALFKMFPMPVSMIFRTVFLVEQSRQWIGTKHGIPWRSDAH